MTALPKNAYLRMTYRARLKSEAHGLIRLWWMLVGYEEVTLVWGSLMVKSRVYGKVVQHLTSDPHRIFAPWLNENVGREYRDWQFFPSDDVDKIKIRVRKKHASTLSLYVLTHEQHE